METLRKANFQDGEAIGVLSEISTDKVTISSIDSKEIEGVVDEYPFDGQTVYFGTLKYSKGHPFDEELTHEVEVEFTVRTGSGIFTLQNEQDNPHFSDLIYELNQSLPEKVVVSTSINPTNEQIWEFIGKARDKISIEVLYDERIQEFLELDEDKREEVAYQGIVDSAELVFEFANEPITVVYDGRRLNLGDNHEETREYVVQTLEKIVSSEGRF